ncbi:MAG: cyclic nucleotide-binding domain-containing protein [Caldithrix sp.]|nr:cyclic nucleotide-binding domain-containing protein [Caldithrix sp.]
MTKSSLDIDSLKNVPLFKNLNQEILTDLGQKLELIKYNQGDRIIRQGDLGNYLYIIKEGQAKVVAEMDLSNEETLLSRLSKDDYFGEMALLTGEPRSASVIAESDIELLRLAKTEFDLLLLKEPTITLSMTHMLSQRLRLTDKKLHEIEQSYKRRIAPRGQLGKITVIQLLKFAEENSFTGKIRLLHRNNMAEFEYIKGQLDKLSYDDKEEDEAMDEILQWNKGEFIVEPKEIELPANNNENDDSQNSVKTFNTVHEAFELYLSEMLLKLVRLCGSRGIQKQINQSIQKFGAYFDVTDLFSIKLEPEFDIRINSEEPWTDKHTLFTAVLMRNLIKALERDMVGMDFWHIHSSDPLVDNLMEEHMFFTYHEQAEDFIKD